MPIPGGVLIFNQSGTILGAVGVSGTGSIDEDEYCAMSGVLGLNSNQYKIFPEKDQCKTKLIDNPGKSQFTKTYNIDIHMDKADEIADNAIVCAQQNLFNPIAVSIVNEGGNIIVYKRMDGC